MNEQLFCVRDNLWNFLRLARKLKIIDWLWIDAVSIDQETVSERNHQVRQMGEIYRGAKHVLAYPGSCSGLLKLASMLVRKTPPANDRLWRSSFTKYVRYFFRSPLLNVARLPYWNRGWIVQELLGARDCFVVSRSGLIGWKSFQTFYTRYTQDHGAGVHPTGLVYQYCDPLEGATRYNSRKTDLGSLLTKFHEFPGRFCTDRRDYVYSLLGLAEDARGFLVDYETTTKSLFLDTIQHFKLTVVSPSDDLSLQGLMTALEVRIDYYCERCAAQILPEDDGKRPELGKDHRFCLLVVDDWPEASRTDYFFDDCATCHKRRLCGEYSPSTAGPPLPHGGQYFVRAREDMMYCFTHESCFSKEIDDLSTHVGI